MATPLQFSGMNFGVNVGLDRINVKNASVSITDNSAVATENGRPSGPLDGSVEGSGELELTTGNLKTLISTARSYGSWRAMPPIDVSFYASTAAGEVKVEAFGCKLSLGDLLGFDGDGSDAVTHKVPFNVTSDDFIHIDGVPYIEPLDS